MIWFFGDSYSTPPETSKDLWEYKNNWMSLVTSNLQTEKKTFASYGAANEWILYNFFNSQSSFQENDYVIVQTTTSNRRWFFEDSPNLGNFHNANLEKYLSKEQNFSINSYIKYLYHEKQDSVAYTTSLYSLFYMAEKMQFIKMLVLPGAHGCPGVSGDLTTDVCNKEFSSIKSRDAFYKEHGHDPRPNHMSEVNHLVLADKVTAYFKSWEPVDLTKDFHYNIF